MIESDVIIVGAGPAGSTCAWKLQQAGVSVRLLDKKAFPRPKLCAGWITPRVFRDLELDSDGYPYPITRFSRLHIYIKGFGMPIPTTQYAIRRLELDDWLVKRSGVTLHQHQVNEIVKAQDRFVIDRIFTCRYLVGAAGTGCPVYRTFFRQLNPRSTLHKITTLEDEFPYTVKDQRCYLWFLDHGLPGYSWYLPKTGGYLNIGIGGKFEGLKKSGTTIRDHWNLFVKKLERRSLVNRTAYSPKGYNYYLRQGVQTVEHDNAVIIGDAAGLATVDMGEGIGPAVHSGMLAAESIINKSPLFLKSIGKYSFPDMLLSWRKSAR
jgi:flavin-dependent dehydrogenase